MKLVEHGTLPPLHVARAAQIELRKAQKTIRMLEERLQDLYDWGPGENAPPAAHEAWDLAWQTLHRRDKSSG